LIGDEIVRQVKAWKKPTKNPNRIFGATYRTSWPRLVIPVAAAALEPIRGDMAHALQKVILVLSGPC